MESVGLKEDDALDSTKWKNNIQNHSGNTRRWEKPEEKKKRRIDERIKYDTYVCTKQMSLSGSKQTTLHANNNTDKHIQHGTPTT